MDIASLGTPVAVPIFPNGENVYRFRKLIQARGPEELSELRQSLLVGKQIALLIPRIGHRAEFVHVENTFFSRFGIDESRPRLPEQDRLPHLYSDHHRNESIEPPENQKGKRGADDIKDPLGVFFVKTDFSLQTHGQIFSGQS